MGVFFPSFFWGYPLRQIDMGDVYVCTFLQIDTNFFDSFCNLFLDLLAIFDNNLEFGKFLTCFIFCKLAIFYVFG